MFLARRTGSGRGTSRGLDVGLRIAYAACMEELTFGVRELQAKIGAALAAVKRGDRVLITSNGRPVARLIPANGKVPGESALERKLNRMAAEGKLIRGRPGRIPPFRPFLIGGLSEQLRADRHQ